MIGKREIALSKSKKLLSVKEQEKANLEALSNKVAEDKTMQKKIIPKIKKLHKELSELLDSTGD